MKRTIETPRGEEIEVEIEEIPVPPRPFPRIQPTEEMIQDGLLWLDIFAHMLKKEFDMPGHESRYPRKKKKENEK